MIEDIKNTIKQSAVYGLSRISTKLVGFILLPLYSLNFSIAEYGIIGRLETLWQILWAVFLFGLESGIVRWYTKIVNEHERKRFLFSITLFLLIINILGTFLIFLSSDFLSTLIFENNKLSTLVLYTAITASLEALIFVVFLLIRINERALMYSVFSILVSLINLSVQYYFIVYTASKLEGVFIAKIIAPGLVLLILLPYYIRFLGFGLDMKVITEIIRYSFPIMLGSFVITLLNQFDRYLLGHLSTPEAVGVYVLGFNICGLINFLIISPFTLAFAVISWKKLSDENARRFFTKTVTYTFFITLYCSLFISLFVPHLIKVFTLNTQYWPAMKVVPFIAMAVPFYGIHFIAVFSFYVTKKTNLILLSYLMAFILNIILNIVLIPILAIYGSAISYYLSYLFLNITLYSFSKKQYFIKFEWVKIFLMSLVAGLLILPFFTLQIESRMIQILLKIIAVAAFPFILLPFRFYEPIEIQKIKGFVNKYLKRS